MNQRFERQIKKGVLEMLVMELLTREKMYGYQIIQTLRRESDAFFSLKEGTLYPILYRLEENGLAVSQWFTPDDGSAPKKYYGITESGRVELDEQKALWQSFTKSVQQILYS